MTETEWAACNDPKAMLAWVTNHHLESYQLGISKPPSDRRLRLFAAACCEAAGLQRAAADYIADEYEKINNSVGAMRWAAHWAGDPRLELSVRANLLRHLVRPHRPAWTEMCGRCEGKRVFSQTEHGAGWKAWGECQKCSGRGYLPIPPPDLPATVVGLARACYKEAGSEGAPTYALADSLEEIGLTAMATHFRETTWCPKGCHFLDALMGV
jgi:hypothetical protein